MASKNTISITFKIKDVDGGFKELSADAESFRKAMESALEEAEKLKPALVNFAAVATGITATNNALKQLQSTIQDLTSESAEFSKAMREANTMAGKDDAGFDALKDQVADLAKEIPIARDALANGLYQTISNGVPEDNWLEYLNTSARAAVGGLADINKVVGVTATLIKNYGLEWSAAAEIQDKIQLTAKNGVTSFEQLAQALPRVAGNAATLGVSINELMGTFATLTGVSGNTAEVSTQLAAIFTALVKPSSDAAEMAAEMGIQFDAAAIKSAGGFQNFLAQLDKSIKTYAKSTGVLEQEVYGRLFSSAEALRALIPLQGELADKFSDNIANMVGSAGTMDAAFAEMSNTSEAVAQKMSNSWAGVKDAIYNVASRLQPFFEVADGTLSAATNVILLTNGVKALGLQLNVVKGLHDFWKATGEITSQTKGLTKAVGTARLFIANFGHALMGGAEALQLFATAWRGALIATGVGAAIAVAITGLIVLFNKWRDSASEAAAATERAAKARKTLTDIAEEGYETTDVKEGESYEDRIARLQKARQEMIDRINKIRSVTLLNTRKGKATKEDQQNALAEMEALRAQRRRFEKAIEQAKAKQKKEEGVVVTPQKNAPKSITPTKSEPIARKGSIAELENRISDLNTKIRFEIDPESRTKLYNELLGLENQKRRIEFEYKFPDKVEKPDIMPDLGKVETDITKIKPEIIDVANAFSNTGDEAEMTTEAMANGFGDLFSSLSGLGSALELPELNVAGTMAQAIATMVAGYAKATEQSTALGPFAWLAFAATGLAQLTAIVSSVKSLPAFANGGIVSGPTVGLIGEYAGASNNPEVVAPLDKLRGMLNPAGAPVIVGGTLRASGRDLVCVLANETRIASKSGLRTNIKF